MKTPDIETKTSISTRNKLLWLLLITFGGLTYFAGYYFPPTLQIQNKYLPECPTKVYNELGYQCGYFDSETNPVLVMEADNLNFDNVFARLEAQPTLQENKIWNKKIPLKYELSIYAVDKNNEPLKALHRRQQKEVEFTCNGKLKTTCSPASSGATTNRKHQKKAPVTCTEKPETSCSPELLGEVPVKEINNDRYLFIIKLTNTKDMTNFYVKDLKLVFVTVNPIFETYLTYFKWILFGFAIAGFVIYRSSLVQVSKEFTSEEQKKITLMSFFLIFFTQPFVQQSALSSNHAYSLISMGVTCGLASILMAFWLTLLERLSSDGNRVSGATKIGINLLAFALFMVSLGAYGLLSTHQESNPLLDLQSDPDSTVKTCKLGLYGLLFVACVWTVIRMCKIIPKIKALDWRDSTSFTFTFCYMLCYMFFMGTGTLQAVNFKGARVVLLYGISTLYTLLLQIMYVPFDNEIEEAEEQRKYENKEAKAGYGNLESSEAASKNHEGIEAADNEDEYEEEEEEEEEEQYEEEEYEQEA